MCQKAPCRYFQNRACGFLNCWPFLGEIAFFDIISTLMGVKTNEFMQKFVYEIHMNVYIFP